MTDEKCGATCSDGSECEAWAMENGRCRHHGGKSTGPKTEEGKKKSSSNAQKHALHADRGLFYERLDDDKQAEVDKLEKSLIDRYQSYHGRNPDHADVKDLFEIAVGYVQRDYAREWMVEQMEDSGNPLLEHVEMEKNGEEVEFDKPNSLLEHIDQNRREDRMQRKDKGLEKDPESQKADSMDNLAEVWEADLTD